MDFDNLPNDIFVQILQQLPFKERLRVSRVNRRFKAASELAISRTTALNLTAPIFREAKPKSMKKLFQLCAGHQKKVICEFLPDSSNVQRHSTMMERLRLFLQIQHPRLEFIDLDTQYGTKRDYPVIRDMLANHPSLPVMKSLSWTCPNGRFPNIVCERLEYLKLNLANDDHSFQALSSAPDYCPKVKHLAVSCGGEKWQEILSTYFAKMPALHSLRLWTMTLNLLEIENMWKLTSLRKLALGTVSVELLAKISTSFPQLESLEFTSERGMTVEGATAFKGLRNLREVIIPLFPDDTVNVYATEMAKCDRLQIVDLSWSDLTSTTVAAFVFGCPQLQLLQIFQIPDVTSPEMAATFVKSLGGFVQENLQIEVVRLAVSPKLKAVWQNDQVQSVMDEINESAYGQIRIIGMPNRIPPPCPEECERDYISRDEKPKKSICRRLIMAIRNLPRKMMSIFK